LVNRPRGRERVNECHKGEEVKVMQLSAPKAITFWIAVALAILGGIATIIPAVAMYAILLVTAGFILLMLGNVLKGL
jgi:hypothetical protein